MKLFSFSYSTLSTSPITWLIDGPQTTHHNFNVSFCQISLRMTLHNSSDTVANVCVNTFDSPSGSDQSSGASTTQSSVPSGNQSGWYEVRALPEIKVTSSVPRIEVGKSSLPLPESVSPFIWSGSSATSVRLEPKSTAKIPLEICVFSPGTYDLSNYSLNWNLLGVNDQGSKEATTQSSGTCQGYPYFLTVLQSA